MARYCLVKQNSEFTRGSKPMWQVIRRIPWKTAWFPDGIPIYGFGLMLFLAFILCTWLAGLRAKWSILSGIGLGRYLGGPNEGDDFPYADKPQEKIETAKALIQDLAIWLFVSGLAGARLTFMYHHPDQREGGFWAQLVDITNGGIILYGSILGALVGYAAFCGYLYWRKKVILYPLRIADLAAPSVALGIGLGRIGCLLNGCCYGHVACAECSVAPAVEFPLSAPPRYVLVNKGLQTAAGFTLADLQPDNGVRVGVVDPASAAYQAGLRDGDLITAANGKPLVVKERFKLTDDSLTALRADKVPDAVLAKLSALKGKGYETADDFDESLRKTLTEAELEQNAGYVLRRAQFTPSKPSFLLTRLLFDEWPRGGQTLELTRQRFPDALVYATGVGLLSAREEALPAFRPKTLGLYPTQAFETISMALLLLLLLAFFAYRTRDGQVIALLMMCYAVHRTLNELLRDDVRPEGFEKYASYILFAGGALLMIWVTRKPVEYKSEWELAI